MGPRGKSRFFKKLGSHFSRLKFNLDTCCHSHADHCLSFFFFFHVMSCFYFIFCFSFIILLENRTGLRGRES